MMSLIFQANTHRFDRQAATSSPASFTWLGGTHSVWSDATGWGGGYIGGVPYGLPSANGTVILTSPTASSVVYTGPGSGGASLMLATLTSTNDILSVATGTLEASSATLGGSLSLTGGLFEVGTLTTNGATSLAIASNSLAISTALAATNSSWSNSGTVSDGGTVTLAAASGHTASIVNQSGASFVLTSSNAAFVGSGSGGFGFSNAGTILDQSGAGIVAFGVALNNTGLINLGSNVVQLNAGGTLAGTLSGSGTVRIASAGATLSKLTTSATILVADGQALYGQNTVTNKSVITLASNGDSTDLIVNGPSLTLNGNGTVTLSDNPNNYIYGAAAADALVNTSNLIKGSGNLGNGQLTLINKAAGIIDASGANALIVSTGTIAVSNAGLIEATGGGGLVIDKTAVNNGSTGIIAAAGGNVILQTATIQGGTLTGSAGGRFIDSIGGTLDGSSNAITNASNLIINDNQALSALGTLSNSGTITVNANNDGTAFIVDGPTLTLTGGGALTLSNSSNNYIYGASASDVFDNVNNTISGCGTLGDNQLTLINGTGGIIDATASWLTLNTGSGGTTNAGLIEATTASLYVVSTSIANTGGTIAANGSNVYLQGASIAGGLLAGGNVIVTSAGSTLDGASNAVTNTGYIAASDNNALYVLGTLVNQGTLLVNANNDGTELIVAGPTLTLTGGGTLAMSNSSNNYIYGAAASDILDNVNNTISGCGTLGDNQLTLINGASGIIDATASWLTLNTGSGGTTNAGLIEATTASLYVVSTSIANTGGTIAANGSNVYLQGASIAGGLLAGGNVIFASAGSILDGSSNAITNTGYIAASDNNDLYVLGTLINQGTLLVNANNDGTALVVDGPTLTLTGGGTLAMSNSTNNYIMAAATGDVLDNVNNLIDGVGTIGGGLELLNEAGGVIDSNQGNVIVIATGASGTINDGLLEATQGALQISNTTVSNTTGTIAAAGGNIDLTGATIEGGLLTGSKYIYASAGATLDGTSNAVTNTGYIIASDNNDLYVLGTLVNQGTLLVNANNDGTYLMVGGASSLTLTLTGGGTLAMSNSTNNYIVAAAAGAVLDNVNNLIEGVGTIGGGLELLNQAGGVIDSNQGNAIVIATGTSGTLNDGLLESTLGALVIAATSVSNTTGTISAAGGNVDLSGATIEGGLIGGSKNIYASASSVLDGSSTAVTNTGYIVVSDNNALYALGTLVNEGALLVNANNDGTELIVDGPTLTLTGGGTLAMSNSSNNYIYGAAASDILDNVNNTISGCGTLGDNQLTLINGTSGIIDATASWLTLNTGSGGTTNNGLIEATTANLYISGTSIANAAGTISAAGAHVYLAGATIKGGLLSGGSAIYANASSVLDGSSNAVTNTAYIVGADGNALYALGTLVNQGTVLVNCTGDNTEFIINGPTLTLSGSGTLQMTDASNNYIYGATAHDVLDNAGNLIEGAGYLGGGALVIANAGTIAGTGGLQLDISAGATLTNSGWLTAIGTAGHGGLWMQSGAVLTNDVAGKLTAGNYESLTSGSTEILSLSGIAVSIDAANLILSGIGSVIEFGGITVDQSLTGIAHGGKLQMLAGRNFTSTNALANSGSLILGGGTVTLASLTDTTSGVLNGFGTIAAPLHNAGLIEALGGTLTLAGQLDGAGALAAAAKSTLHIAAGATIRTISGAGTVSLGALASGAINSTVATLAIATTGTLDGSGKIAGVLIDSGIVAATGGTMTVTAKYSGTGTLNAGTGAMLSLNGAGNFDGSLSGTGTIVIGANSKLLAGATLGAANIVAKANLASAASLTNAPDNIFTISTTAGHLVELSESNGASFTNQGVLSASGAGTAALAGNIVNLGTISNAAGSLNFLGTLTNNGTVTTATGAVSFANSVAGTGELVIDAGQSLSLLHGAGSGQIVDFAAAGGHLDLASAALFAGQISGFASGDVVDLLKINAGSYSFSGGVLTLDHGTTMLAALHVNGDYASNAFVLSSDGHGGTMIALG